MRCLYTVTHSLPDGQPVEGVTILAGEIYLLRWKERRHDQVEVYDIATCCLQRCLTVPNARGFTDMTSCEHYLCLYISDPFVACVHSLNVPGISAQWAVFDEPAGLSVSAAHNVLVTCPTVRKIKEFSSNGGLLREITLPLVVVNPVHAIQTRSGQFIVCHGSRNDQIHRICMISADGQHIVHSHGGYSGSSSDQYNVPNHLAVDDNESVFVADRDNRRVTLLSPTLEYVRQVVSPDQLKWSPFSLFLDIKTRRLYVADSEWKVDKYAAGRVVIVNV